MAIADLTFERGLPASVDTERLVLGSILLNDAVYLQVAGSLSPEDFSLEKHRRIYSRMRDLYERGERIDRVTMAEELMKQGQLESVDLMVSDYITEIGRATLKLSGGATVEAKYVVTWKLDGGSWTSLSRLGERFARSEQEPETKQGQ